ncbi:divergent PAP2 family protein [Salinibacillus xinjiangensis]|uniref:Divergent PAP2 family protein n=1 Tax=Salinibacillus xinjiangensis TaxID=1229268 RepID=A0A6G1X3T4_9BACI|nr:divergent PAP2 family protein [Salinibacillus xinjiangensis]MRG85566.1 divergent PAP2 family protein [Salinibacillus xinjiangensis]
MIISYPIFSALMATILAQVIKIPLNYIKTNKWNFKLVFSTGGMPSSHTATVVALTTAIGILEGIHSNDFAISFILTVVVMHDATGVRRQAGEHAELLNQLVQDFNGLLEILKHPNTKNYETKEKLKELLGHKPLEVFFGALFGIMVAVFLFSLYPFPEDF